MKNRESWICRTWSKDRIQGWQSQFERFDTKEEAEAYGKMHVEMFEEGFDELERDYEVYRNDIEEA